MSSSALRGSAEQQVTLARIPFITLSVGRHTMRRILILLVIAAVVAGPAVASEKTDVLAVVREWTGLFSSLTRDAGKSALATCADEASILDDISPYVWSSPGACRKFLDDHIIESQKSAVTDIVGTLLKPWHVIVTGDHAYVVVPINFTFKVNGKAAKEDGAILVAALRRSSTGWHVTAASIAEH
jgi:hypothetical protein